VRYLALACDYDGTLAHHGRVDEPTLAALERVLASGRKLLLVTGRELDELQTVFPQLHLFEWIVAENGALLYRPAAREEKLLAERPSERFIQALRDRGVQPMSVGRVIVATWRPHETTVLDVIREQGLEMQVIFNKDAVMVLPAGINKASGLAAALHEMELSPHNVVGVGDAENDHAFLSVCEASAAVANALPALKERADLVTRGDHGAGVRELIDALIGEDLAALEGRLLRHHLRLGTREDGSPADLRPYHTNVLIAGPSGSGKSTVAAALLERLAAHKYQFCIIDPEGDYECQSCSVSLGTTQHPPAVEEVVRLLRKPEENVNVNLVGQAITERPLFFLNLLPHLQELRARTGRPHWLVVDEAHHLLPASWLPASAALPDQLDRTLLITVHPNQVSPAVLSRIDVVLAVGQGPAETIGQFCEAVGQAPPRLPAGDLPAGEVVMWARDAGDPIRVRVDLSHQERRRHSRKYAEGELPPERSFYFRGPEGKLKLRAQNLILFNQIAEGVDDETWVFHLRQGDYARWFRDGIKDDELAEEAERVARQSDLSPEESRRLIKAAVEQRYTAPSAPTLPMPGTAAAAHKDPALPIRS
jgi:HAD superfamily hydrolase (TIGR01484 family)